MAASLKDQTIKGMFWSVIERFGSIMLQFIANILLARILDPVDFGLIGMIMVFIAISNTIVESGLGAALVNKKEATEKDSSTIFYINTALSFVFFILLIVFAPYIAEYYRQPQLTILLRILSFILIFNALNNIQYTQLIKNINFKQLAKVNLAATSIACLVSVIMAYNGFGVWSLVTQLVLIAFIRTILFWIWSKWRPKLIFSISSLKELFGFGSKLLLSALLDTIYNNLQALVIGRVFSARDLGFYSQAKKFEEVPSYTFSSVVNQVTFPVFVTMQDDYEKLKNGVRKSMKLLVFMQFPLMFALIIIAKPLFELLFTSKWNEAVPYFQILCFSGMLLSMHTTNLNILKAIGKSNTFLYLEIAKKIIGLLALIIGMQFGVMGMVIGIAASSYLSLFLNAFYSGGKIGYGVIGQMKDVLPAYILAFSLALALYLSLNLTIINNYLYVTIALVIYTTAYLGLAKMFKFEAFDILLSIFNDKIISRLRR